MTNLTKNTNKIDYNVESLRGYAAVFVVIHHIFFYHEYLDPNYFRRFLKFFEPPGLLCVLVFFLLSGYVIGTSQSGKKELTKINYIDYLKKRLIRLYPIYALLIIFALVISNTKYDYKTILSNLLFTQNVLSSTIYEINPIWSINYEVLYYLLFIPIALYKISPLKVMLISIFVSFVFFCLNVSNGQIIASYCNGLAFWVGGLFIAKNLKKDEKPIDTSLLLSNLFLLLSLLILIGTSVSCVFSGKSAQALITFPIGFRVKIGDLFFLPYCFIFISNFANKVFYKKKTFLIVFQLLPILTLYPVIKFMIIGHHYTFAFGVITYLISTFIFFTDFYFIERVSNSVIKIGAWFGQISYSMYLIHFPILVIFGKIQFFSGSAFTYSVRFILFGLVVISSSYFLEKKYQPFIRKILSHNKI